VIGKHDPSVDVERCAGAHSPDRIPQRADLCHQQIRPAVEQVRREEECPARDPIATIIHEGSMPGVGGRLPLLRQWLPAPPLEGCRPAADVEPQRSPSPPLNHGGCVPGLATLRLLPLKYLGTPGRGARLEEGVRLCGGTGEDLLDTKSAGKLRPAKAAEVNRANRTDIAA
jgi:hypothetical protein